MTATTDKLKTQLTICLYLTNATVICRYHFEIKISNQEKQIQDMGHVLSVMELRHERATTELLSKHEKEIQFMMAQIRHEEMGHAPRESISNSR